MSDQSAPTAPPKAEPATDVPEMPEPQVRETAAHSIPGGLALLLTVIGVGLGIASIAVGGTLSTGDNRSLTAPFAVASAVLLIGSFFFMTGVKMVAPGEARVIQFFGRYIGTVRRTGLTWVVPFTNSTRRL